MKAARWPCHYCDFECTSRDYLILHEECHLDEHRDRVTRQRTWRPRRAIYHSNSERPYQCTVCGQAFSQKMNLARHMQRHTGEKPYQCQLCPMRFNQKCNLERHVRCHTGERPFHCTFCAKSFNSKSNLSRHEACHLVRASPEMATLANFSV